MRSARKTDPLPQRDLYRSAHAYVPSVRPEVPKSKWRVTESQRQPPRILRMCLVFSTIALAFTAIATASGGWTPAQAAAKVKATYTTVDQKAYDFAKEHGYTDAMRVQLHAAKPTSVSCKGAGAATAGRYSRFHCVVQVQGSARIPPDYELYTATKKLTVTVAPFRVLAGWR